MSQQTLERILQSQGFGTRNWCAGLIAGGEVSIEGEIVRDPRRTFATDGLEFSVYGEPWQYRGQVYIALHKPADMNVRASPAITPACCRYCRNSSRGATCSRSGGSTTTPPACC